MGCNWRKHYKEKGIIFKSALVEDIFLFFLLIGGLIPLALCIYGTFFQEFSDTPKSGIQPVGLNYQIQIDSPTEGLSERRGKEKWQNTKLP